MNFLFFIKDKYKKLQQNYNKIIGQATECHEKEQLRKSPNHFRQMKEEVIEFIE